MLVLAFRHIPFEPLGLIEDALRSRGIGYQYVDLPSDTDCSPDVDNADALIFMGGPMSANDPLPWIERELSFIRRGMARNQPILGVCLGSQLIARALGSRVYKNAVKEIGWAPVYLTEAAARDPLLRGLGGPETIFHWHGETFDLPPGAEHIAYSDACRNQAFRVDDSVYGFQFHLEVTPEMIRQWCVEDANEGDLREVIAPIDADCNSSRLAELSDVVFGRWCDLVKEAACVRRA